MARDDFSESTKRLLQNRVGSRCSNPACRKSTNGPQQGGTGAISLGEAAHICAASSGGPRYNQKMTKHERVSYDNGIWLCNNCATLIDRDPFYYTVQLLNKWKEEAERSASAALTGLEEIIPRFQVDCIGYSGGLSSLVIRITNVSSFLVSNLTSIRLFASFIDREIEVSFNPSMTKTILDKKESTDVHLHNSFFCRQ